MFSEFGTRLVLCGVALGLVGLSAWCASHFVTGSAPRVGQSLHESPANRGAIGPRSADDLLEARFTTRVQPFLERYCYGCHGPEKHKAALDLSRDSTATAVANNLHRWEQVLDRLQAEEMPPEECAAPAGSGRTGRSRRLDSRFARPGNSAKRRRSGDGAGPPPEQRRVRLHDPRPDGRGHPADARVPGRSRQRGRFRQLGRIARHVAGPAQEVPGGGAAGRRPRRLDTGRASPSPLPGRDRHRPRQVLRPAHHRLLRAPQGRLRRLLPGRLEIRCARPARRGPRPDCGRGGTEREVSGDGLVGPDR